MNKIDQSQLSIFEIYAIAARENAMNPPEYFLPGGEYVRKIDHLLGELSTTAESRRQAQIPELTSEEKQNKVRKILSLERKAQAGEFPVEEMSILRERVEEAFACLRFDELKKVLTEERYNEYKSLKDDSTRECLDF